MTDTIELLENIGRDASLRHSSSENLAQALSGLQASEGLKQAAISGDSSHLARELGHNGNEAIQQAPQIPHNGGYGGFDEDEAEVERPDEDSENQNPEDK